MRTRWHVPRSAIKSESNDANDYQIDYSKMLESPTTTPTTTLATSSTSGEMPAPSSSPSAKNARRPSHTSSSPTTASSTITRSQRVKVRTSGPTTRRPAHPDQLLYSNKVDELPSSRSALSNPSTSTTPGILAASTQLTNAAISATFWVHLSCHPTLQVNKMIPAKAEEARPFARTLPYLLL